MRYIYGPVSSWRLGRSLGIDLIAGDKKCSFDCCYCQLGTFKSAEDKNLIRQNFVPTQEVLNEFESLPEDLRIDYITFSGMGEPTLARNLGEVIAELKKRSSHKIAVLTNSSLFSDPAVRGELGLADLVLAKLDAADEEVFKKINNPAAGLSFDKFVEGIKTFKKEYPAKLALQIMFCETNKANAKAIAELAKEIGPVVVYIGTPVRHCNEKPLAKEEIDQIELYFKPLQTYNVYTEEKKDIPPLEEKETLRRRPRLGGGN